ncbi:multicopper oxidase family protein [Trinickia acidisoli]|uniref:multicopper oxidase family protein n=1 Tax=Trinickia acidisoli TaxID=2767482 RepID=UPI001A907E50|nr:multicopper oxidase domain-containing protein [Trinickia acidisoli]
MRFTRLIAAVAACATLSLCTLASAAPASVRSFVDLGGTPGVATSAAAQRTQQPGIPASCSGPAYVADASRPITLDAGYSSYRLYNPSTNAYDPVEVRAYNGCPTGPTINVDPGQTLKVRVNNTLPPESSATCPPNAAHDAPHCFNTVNLHLHGMHVSPSGNSDNVFMSIPPGTSANYVYQIPANHPAGTFWYHSHHHGSAAIDVTSGMEGVLIVRGHRTAARRWANGGMADIDTILHDRAGTPFPEHVFLFQQIEYGCFANASAAAPLADPTTYAWICPTGDVGELRNYTNQLSFVADPRPGYAGQFNSTWTISGRYTQINGVVQPMFPSAHGFLPAGQIQRWRLVHGGDRDTINLKVVRVNLAALGRAASAEPSPQDVDAAADAANALLAGQPNRAQRVTTLDQICSGEVVKQIDIANDGLTRSAMVEQDVNTLDPGYRRDVLMAFPTPGLYCVLDEAAEAASTISYRPGSSKVKDRRLLALVRVGPGTNIPDYTPDGLGHSKYWQYVRNRLVDANADLPPDVLADLRTLDTHVFAPEKPLDGPIHKQVPMLLDVGFSNGAPSFTMNGESYDPSRIDYTAVLGTTDEWHLTAGANGGHVFHIHINPFEIVDILNAQGVSIYDSSGHCTAAEIATGDQEYCTLHDVFLDTIFIKPGYTVVMRTHYRDFTGEFVMHCHILDHEDAGMMQNVEVVTPTTALISRITAPLVRAKDGIDTFVDDLRYGRQRSNPFAFTAPICSAGNVEAIASK